MDVARVEQTVVSDSESGGDHDEQQDNISSVNGNESLRDLLDKLRQLYTSAVMSGSKDRIGFETVIGHLEEYVLEMESEYSSRLERTQAEAMGIKLDTERKIREWSDRYNKLHTRWDECMAQINQMQEEKEDLRRQRDALLMPDRAQSAADTEVDNPVIESSADVRLIQENFFRQIMENVLYGVTEALEADRGSIFIYHSPSSELRSLCLVATSGERLDAEIRIASTNGIVGMSFSKGQAMNIANAYQDDRFYKVIDQETGYVTNSILCYPLYSPRTEAGIGVLQLINKKTEEACFTVEDEFRMSEYAYLISAMLDFSKDLFHFGKGGNYVKQITSTDGSEESGNPNQSSGPKVHVLPVKRFGHGTREEDIRGQVGRKTALIPRDIEEYIRKLEQSWRNAVKDCAFLHNVKAQVELERNNAQKRVFALENQVQILEELISAFTDKNVSANKRHKLQQLEALEREKQLKMELSKYRRLYEESQRQSIESSNLNNLLISSITSPSKGNKGGMSTEMQLKAITENVKNLPADGSPSKGKGVTGSPLKGPKRMRRFKPTDYGVHLPLLDDKSRSPQQELEYPDTPRADPRSPSGSRRKGIHSAVFQYAPVPACILTKNHRIWRANVKLCELIGCTPEDLLGRQFSEMCIINPDSVPRLLQFDLVQGLGIRPPVRDKAWSVRSLSPAGSEEDNMRASADTDDDLVYRVPAQKFVKVDMHISVVGRHRQRLVSRGMSLEAPIYVLVFNKPSSSTSTVLPSLSSPQPQVRSELHP